MHCLFTAYPPIRYLFLCPLPIRCLYTICPLHFTAHCLPTAYHRPFTAHYCPLTALSLPTHWLLSAYSDLLVPIHCPPMYSTTSAKMMDSLHNERMDLPGIRTGPPHDITLKP
jgi:hypothetical protein